MANRQERRRQERVLAKDEVFTLKRSDIVKMVDKELDNYRKSISKEVVDRLTASFIITLHDDFGFGKNRIVKLIERLNEGYDSIEKGYVTFEDFQEWCEKYGIDIKDIFGENKPALKSRSEYEER